MARPAVRARADGPIQRSRRRTGRARGLRPAYHRGVTDRGRSPESFACPFVAFEDDRDGRSDAPDPRHRCFAELRPAPRAIAHQQAYCLSPSFAACPTFVDWAQREAARVRVPEHSAESAGLAASAAGSGLAGAEGHEAAPEPPDDVWPKRPEREWAAPPPWSAEDTPPTPEAPGAADAGETPPPPFLADRGYEPAPPERYDEIPPAAAAASVAATRSRQPAPAYPEDRSPHADEPSPYDEDRSPNDQDEAEPPMRRFTPASRRGNDQSRSESSGPSWETPHRYEAYPTLRSPRSMPNLSPLVLGVAALIIGALALFFLPPLFLGLGGGSGSSTPTPSASGSPVASASAAVSPSPSPSSGALTYTVKQGDNMTSIAKAHGVSVNALIAANPQIKNPNQLSIGDQLTIPTPVPSAITGASPSPSP
jgi:hypothetical protein